LASPKEIRLKVKIPTTTRGKWKAQNEKNFISGCQASPTIKQEKELIYRVVWLVKPCSSC
jgi:hypothetical protein